MSKQKESKPRETLKRKRLVKAIASSDNLFEAGQKAGYSKNSRKIYSKGTKRYIKDFLEATGNSLDDCKKRFNLLMNMALKEKDYKEARANNENITRMAGGYKDKIEQTNISKDSLWQDFQRLRGSTTQDIVVDN